MVSCCLALAPKNLQTGIVFNKDKTVQHQLVLKKRMLPLLWKYCSVLPSHSLWEVIFWVTIHQKELTSSLRKEHSLWDRHPDSRASLPPSGTKLWPTLYWLLKKSYACPYATRLFSRTVGAFPWPQRKFLSAKFRCWNWAHRISLWKASEALSSLQQGYGEWELLFQWTPLLNIKC